MTMLYPIVLETEQSGAVSAYVPGLPVYAWPAPVFEEGVINVRLFPSLDAGRAASGVRRWQRRALPAGADAGRGR